MVVPVEPVFHGDQSSHSVASPLPPPSVQPPAPNDESRSLRNTVHQLIDVCRANQSHLRGLREEVATVRSLVNTLVARPPHLQPIPQPQVNPEVTGPLPEVPPWRVRQTGRASPVFAATKVVLLQFRTVVVCGFVKIIAPAQDAMFMHDKPDHRRDIAVSEGVRPGSPESVSSGFCDEHCSSPQCSVHISARPRCTSSGCNAPPSLGCLVGCCAVHCTHSQCSPQGSKPPRVTRTPNVLSNVCRVRSCNERVHPECSTRRCTLHCASPDCPFHSCPNGQWARNPVRGGPVIPNEALSVGTFNARRLW